MPLLQTLGPGQSLKAFHPDSNLSHPHILAHAMFSTLCTTNSSSAPAAPAAASSSARCRPAAADSVSLTLGVLALATRGAGCAWPAALAIVMLSSACCVCTAQGTWSTAQLSVARFGFAATSVGNVAIFAGGASNCFFALFVEGLLFWLMSVGDAVTFACLRLAACCLLCLRCRRLPSHLVHRRW